MSEMLPMELMWVSFPTQTPRPNLPAEHQKVALKIDHGNGGIQLRSVSGALVGWVDPFDDARAMRVLKSLETLGKSGRIGCTIKLVTVGWPNAGPRLLPAEGKMTMRLLKMGEGVFDDEKAAGKAKSKALAKGRMGVKAGTAIKAQKGVAGGRIVKKTRAKPKPKGAVKLLEAKAGAVKMGEKDEEKTTPVVAEGACAKEEK
ncbi:hypothetical protein EDC01DRAFT_758090 [Geopyxis carbonaria]|nr:hypothetical protein EDC01DRAFT_758090 [Geopyxis carbonaria]